MPYKIMVVDDEPDLEILVRQRFRRQIRDNELTFFFSRNGGDALEQLAQRPEIDLVLSDINMPVMDGLTLLGKLNEASRIRRVIMVSAYGDMANIRTAMNLGAIDFLTKPIDFQDLEITVSKNLQQITQLKQAIQAQEQLFALRQELNIASRIQRAILPTKYPPFPYRRDFELHAAMVPAMEVGGDLFDFFLLDRDHLGFLIGDVSGKGVPAAIYMAITRTLTRGAAVQRLSPGECLQYVNTALVTQNTSTMFVTLFYGILDTRTGEIEYASGGHNPPYLFSSKGCVRGLPLEANGMIVGVLESARYKTATCRLERGEGMLLYTDGVTEAVDVNGDFFTEERLEQFLREHGSRSAELLVSEVHAAVHDFSAGAPQADDITVMALRYQGRGGNGHGETAAG